MKTKLIKGKTYYNPWKEKKFTIKFITGNKVTIQEEDGTIKIRDKKDLKKFLQHTIDKQLPKYEMNVHNDITWTIEMIEKNTTDVNDIFDHMKANVDYDTHDEWTDSRNEWIKKLPNQSKGKFALNAFCCGKESEGCNVEKNESGNYNTGQERIATVDNEKYIVRSTFKGSGDVNITLNHIRQDAEWDKLICMIITPNEIELHEADRDLVYLYLEENPNEIGWITKDDMNVIHWHMKYPLPDIFTKL